MLEKGRIGSVYDRVESDGLLAEAGSVGWYLKQEGEGHGQQQEWAFVSVRLQRRMPHVLLVRRDGSAGELPFIVRSADDVPLEPTVDQQWRTLAPLGFERGVLQILSPDLLAALMARPYRWHLEIVGDRLNLYTQAGDVFTPAIWHDIDALLQTFARPLSEKVYLDRREGGAQGWEGLVMEPDEKAQPVSLGGRRLRRRFGRSWVDWAFGITVGVCFFFAAALLPS